MQQLDLLETRAKEVPAKQRSSVRQAHPKASNGLSQLGVRHRIAACVWTGRASDAVGQRLERKIKGCEPDGSITLLLLMFLGAVENAVVPGQRLRV